MAKLAILASKAVGMGVLHYDASLKVEDIPSLIRSSHDGRHMLSIDYFQGRMVKFMARKTPAGWEVNDYLLPDYQSWSATYSGYDALAAAAGGVVD